MRGMSNFSRLHLAALPWRRWRLSRPLPRRGCSVLRTGSNRESLVGQLEPNDTTAGPLLDPGQPGRRPRAHTARAGSRREPNCSVAPGSAALQAKCLIWWPCPKIALANVLLRGCCRLSKRRRLWTRAKRSASLPPLSLDARSGGGPKARPRGSLTGEEVM